MTYESKYWIDKGLVFKENFEGEQWTRRQWWTPTDVSYSGGKGTFNGSSSVISYNKLLDYRNTDITIKVTFTPNNVSSGDTLISQNVGSTASFATARRLLYCNTYIRSILDGDVLTGTTPLVIWQKYTVILTTTTSWRRKIYLDWEQEVSILSGYNETPEGLLYVWANQEGLRFDWDIDLVEIYNYARTAEQVSNDYNNARFKDVREGLVLDIDSRQGAIQDNIWNTITNNWVNIKRDWVFYAQYYDNFSYLKAINLNTVDLNNVTVCAFVKMSNNNEQSIINFPASSSWVSPFARLNLRSSFSSPWKLEAFIENWSNENYYIVSDDVYFPSNKYIFVCFTYDWITMKLYVNWKLIQSKSVGVTVTNTTEPIYIWSELWGVWTLEGYQNQQRVYNRALSANEISQIYTANKKNYV